MRQQLAGAAPGGAVEPRPVAPKPAGLTLLLCEDDVLIRMATADMLEDLGHRVIATGTARSALDALSKDEIDILITDIGLPDMPGTSLAALARTQFPGLAVIFATGHAKVEGFPPDDSTGIVQKPYDSSFLAEVIATLRRGQGPGA
ncbi:response regulator [Paracoccaceae bacterium Fryx2]|nr:response regulator [Paracoccaceae bacterium Fryx2]